MKHFKSWVSLAVAALLLSACGGGGNDDPANDTSAGGLDAERRFKSVVSFGDSLSDVGTYTPATAVPGTNPPIFLGGRFTTNSQTGRIWIENVATRLGLTITPAEVGFGGRSKACPAAEQGMARTCTAYGQGGARVTDPNGTRHIDPVSGELRALTVPIKTQISKHLARFATFKSGDLIFLWAGANDLLWQMEQDPAINPNSFVIQLFQIQAQLKAGIITPEQARAQIAAALLASQAAMKTAALEMARYIRTEILAKGGRHVVVLNLPDPAVTPEGVATAAQSPTLGAALTTFSAAFNEGLKEGLRGQHVVQIDIRRFISDVVARPAVHHMANTSDRACDAGKIFQVTGGAVADGFALFCNATPKVWYNGLNDLADVDTWFFADGNHPTTGGYRLIGNEVIRQLASIGWVQHQDDQDLP